MKSITTLIYRYGLISMFFLILIEYACFPISSEIVLPFSGAIASMQQIPYFKILPVSVLAGLIGTSICFAIGRLGGSVLLKKIMKRFPKSCKPIESSYAKFNRYGSVTVFIGRMIPLCRTYIAFVAGAVHQNYFTFLFSSFFGITIWNAALIGFGYVLGENWNIAGEYYKRYKHLFYTLLLFLLTLFIVYRRLKKHSSDSPENGDKD